MKPSHISKESQQNIKNIQTKQFNFLKLTQKQTKHMPAKQNNTIIIAKVFKTKIQNKHRKNSNKHNKAKQSLKHPAN
jgi:hypothetical protein